MKFRLKNWEYGMIGISLFLIVSVMFLFYPINTVLGGDDLGFHLNRLVSLAEAFEHKTYPFYISSHFLNGYGYAANWFYPDLLLVPVAFYLKMGGSITLGYKVYMIIVQLLMVLTMYSCMFLVTEKRLTAWLISWSYVFSSYRLIDQYARGAIGENLAFLFYPLILVGLYQLLYKEKRTGLYFLISGFTGLVYTHILSVVMMSLVVAIFCFIRWKIFKKNPKILCYFGLSVGITLLLGAFSLLPMVEQMWSNDWYYQVFPFANLSSSQGYSITQFISSLVNPYEIEPNFIVGMGAVPVLIIVSKFFYKGKKTRLIQFANSSLIIGFVFLFMTTDLFPLKWLSMLDTIQFPWRFNAISSTLLLLAGGIYLSKLETKRGRNWFYSISISIVIILGIQIVQVHYSYQQKYAGTVDTYQNENYVSQYTLGAGSEYLPASTSKHFIEHRGDKLVELNTNQLIAYTRLPKGIQFSTNFGDTMFKQIEIPLIFYKGYEASIDGVKIPIEKSPTGFIQVNTNLIGTVQVYYKGTNTQKGALILSASTFLSIIGGFIYCKTRKDEPRLF